MGEIILLLLVLISFIIMVLAAKRNYEKIGEIERLEEYHWKRSSKPTIKFVIYIILSMLLFLLLACLVVSLYLESINIK